VREQLARHCAVSRTIVALGHSGTLRARSPAQHHHPVPASDEETQALRDELELLRARFELAPDAYYLHDLTGRFVDGNRRAEELIGVSRQELIGSSFIDLALLPASQIPKAIKLMLMGAAGRPTGPTEFLLRRPDGREVWIETRTQPTQQDGKRLILGIARDISDRKHLEDELRDHQRNLDAQVRRKSRQLSAAAEKLDMQTAARRESENQYRQVFDSAHDAILIIDPQTETVLEANDQASVMYGIVRERFVGMSLRELSTDLEHGERHVELTLERGSAHRFNTVQKRGDGTRMHLEVSASVVDFRGRQAILSINRDITGRLRAERALKEREAALQHAEKMEAVGRLAAGIAHDFNNLLTIIQNFSHLVAIELDESDPHFEDLQRIKDAASRASKLTRKLVAISAQQVLRPEVVDLNAAIAEIKKLVRRELGDGVRLVLDLDAGFQCVEIDQSQLDRVLINLIVNGRDAMPGGGTLTLSTRYKTLASNEVPGAKPGDYVVLSVGDTGVGMDEATRARIFEPFYTTKRPGQGTGLGLSTVYGVVTQSGGAITVKSAPGEGTQFDLYFPAASRAMRDEPEVIVPFPYSAVKGETLLIVDDDADVRDAMSATLRAAGYDVLAAANGGEALLLAERHRKKIELLLTDIVMPLASGPDLANRLLPLIPTMRVAYVSGVTSGTSDSTELRLEGPLLEKPFTPEELLRYVRAVLNEPPRHRGRSQSGTS
jgi:PAS domain S-box-containing protein